MWPGIRPVDVQNHTIPTLRGSSVREPRITLSKLKPGHDQVKPLSNYLSMSKELRSMFTSVLIVGKKNLDCPGLERLQSWLFYLPDWSPNLLQ
jgi:hypothetical protein